MREPWRSIVVGAAAGLAARGVQDGVRAAGAALTGRTPRSDPAVAAEVLLRRVGRPALADGKRPGSREAGLGQAVGVTTSLAVGTALGAARAVGWRPGPLSGAAIAAAAAFWADVPMTVLGVKDRAAWGMRSWLGEVVPHLAFGAVAAAVLRAA